MKGMMAAQIKIEFVYFKLVNDIIQFPEIWAVENFFCVRSGRIKCWF